MQKLDSEDVHRLAGQVGLSLDVARARMIASRLSGIIEEMNEIPEEKLASVESHHRFRLEPK